MITTVIRDCTKIIRGGRGFRKGAYVFLISAEGGVVSICWESKGGCFNFFSCIFTILFII